MFMTFDTRSADSRERSFADKLPADEMSAAGIAFLLLCQLLLIPRQPMQAARADALNRVLPIVIVRHETFQLHEID